MLYYVVKVLVTSVLVVAISEVGKRSSLAGAMLASIPLTSVLAMIWLYVDTGDSARISSLATSIFWLVLPSLVLFVVLPLLLKQGQGFYLSLTLAIGATVASYGVMVVILNHFGIKG